jgi:hypothetical protein
MSEIGITAVDAELIAMAVVHEKGATAMAVLLVERLDEGNPYFLVVFGKSGTAGAVVTVDAVNGAITSSAQIDRVEKTWLMEKSKAVELAGCTQLLAARLVWAPSRATRSMFYPLWELTCESGRVYVDHDGRLWHNLPPAGPG